MYIVLEWLSQFLGALPASFLFITLALFALLLALAWAGAGFVTLSAALCAGALAVTWWSLKSEPPAPDDRRRTWLALAAAAPAAVVPTVLFAARYLAKAGALDQPIVVTDFVGTLVCVFVPTFAITLAAGYLPARWTADSAFRLLSRRTEEGRLGSPLSLV